MGNKFIIVEVGSENTKSYLVEDKNITNIGFTHIRFKHNYSDENGLSEIDTNNLYLYIESLKSYSEAIYVYGTSIFRTMKVEHRDTFLKSFEEKCGIKFNIVSQSDENRYTIEGVVGDASYNEPIAILIGGGGSTEITIYDNSIIEEAHTEFGVANVKKQYIDLMGNYAKTSIEEVTNFVKTNIRLPKNYSPRILILAGGGYKMFYELAKYPLEKNLFVDDINQPYMIDMETLCEYDKKFFYEWNLEELKDTLPDNRSWWDGTRAMRGFVNACIEAMNIEYIVPTDISMIYGLAKKHSLE